MVVDMPKTPIERIAEAKLSESHRATLMGLVQAMDARGTGAAITIAALADLTGKSTRMTARNISQLLTAGIIKHGDQRRAAHIPGNVRPIVYDLGKLPK
jgi:hypothetical protein